MNPADKVDAAGKVAGGLLSLWGLFKLAFHIHKKIAASVAKDVDDNLSKKLDEKLEPVLKELRPNGGSSLADQVQAVKTMLEHHSGRVKAFNRDTTEGMFESDATGFCTWVNRTYCRMAQRTEDEVLGWGWLNILHPDEVDEVREHWARCVRDGREYTRSERFQTPDGEEVVVTVRAQPIKNSAGRVLGFIGFVRYAGECVIPADRCPIRRAEEGSTNAH